MVVVLVVVLYELIIFREGSIKNDVYSYFCPVTLIFNILTSKLLCQLSLTCLTYRLSLNVVWFSVYKLMVGTGQMDRHNVAFILVEGCIVIVIIVSGTLSEVLLRWQNNAMGVFPHMDSAVENDWLSWY